ncbi:MAG TPA: nicotinate-nucleotide adenylyltransferase [Longimicrobiales bacterium]|nr:nicotinate-nucleotide adenylyltransferase [Longimicrobiales bacterium]
MTATAERPRLGVFGGTFDPPHVGHLVVAQEVLHRLALDRLLVVPAAVPPHKRDQPVTGGAVRLAMARAAMAALDRVEVSDLELRRDGPSYTVDTLRALRADHPDAELFLVLGADQVRELDTWHEADELRRLATLVVFRRAGQDPDPPGAVATGELLEIEVPRLDISSTEIRRRVGAGEPVRFLVPEAALEVIEREGLYREPHAAGA